jgi:hypothetical protein
MTVKHFDLIEAAELCESEEQAYIMTRSLQQPATIFFENPSII